MSIDFHRTYQSPINNSSSKQLYSFSKASRFEPTQRSPCKQAHYEIRKGAFQRRTTTFGFGNKMNFANTEGVPAATTYSRHSQFAHNKIKNRGYSFGKDQNRSIIENPQQIRKFPGPGSYVSIDQKHKTGYGATFSQISYSMRGKYQNPLSKHANELGPGQYPLHGSIDSKGNYFNTKYVDSKCPKIGRDSRFENQKVQVPGPGHYYGQHKTSINQTGIYFNSKYGTTKANSFGLSVRPSPARKNEAPDPGTYHQFSQFALRNKSVKV